MNRRTGRATRRATSTAAILLALLSIVATRPAAGSLAVPSYPITPRPLRMLVSEAEFIVTARVVAAGEDAKPPDRAFPETDEPVLSATTPNGPPPDVVLLEVDELLKGDPGTRTIRQLNYRTICPAPARYEVGTRVLAFLDRSKKSGDFMTHALSYGAKTLSDDDLALYGKRVKEELAILELPDYQKRLFAQVEWLVTCAEQAATRWEGAYELAREGDFMSEYQRGEEQIDFGRYLTAEQKERLRAAFLASKTFDSGEQCLEELFRDDRDPKLTAWLVARLREGKPEIEDDWRLDLAIERLARRDERVRKLAAAYKATHDYLNPKPDEGRQRARILAQILADY
jgi:hypothetical protein